MKPPRPFSVTLLALLVLLFVALNAVRFALVTQGWSFYGELLSIHPAYLAISGLVWAILGMPLIVGLWVGARWAPRLVAIAALVYSIYYWFEYLLLVNRQDRHANWPFLAILNLILLVWILWVLSRAKAKSFFGGNHER